MIMPTASTTLTAAQPTALFGGTNIFGEKSATAGDLFGMILALLGQSLGAQPTTTDENGNPLNPEALLNSSEDAATNQTSLLALLAQLNGQQAPATQLATNSEVSLQSALNLLKAAGLPPKLTALLESLEGGEATIASLQENFAGLSEEDQSAILAEIAALMPAPATPATPVAAPAEPRLPFIASNMPTPAGDDIAPAEQGIKPQALPPQSEGITDKTAGSDKAAAEKASAQPVAAPVETPKPKEKASSLVDKSEKTSSTTSKGIALEATLESASAEKASAAMTEIAKAIHEAARTQRKSSDDANAALVETKSTKQSGVATPEISPMRPEGTIAPQTASAVKPVGGIEAVTTTNLQQTGPDLTPQPTTPGEAKGSTPANQASFADTLGQLRQGPSVPHAPVSEQIAVRLHKAFSDGSNRVTINLKPQDLGRIEVRLDFSSDGRVMAMIAADNPVTLDLLRRDQSGLQQALSDAGLKTDGGSLNFNLRGDQQRNFGHNDQQGNAHNGGQQGQLEADKPLPAAIDMVWHISPDRLDVRI